MTFCKYRKSIFLLCLYLVTPGLANHELYAPKVNQILQNGDSLPLDEAEIHEKGATQRLREDLLRNYDNSVYPWLHAWKIAEKRSTFLKGLHVGVNINFHKTLNIDPKAGNLDLLVWYRLQWDDPRLTWDPKDYGGLTTVFFEQGLDGLEIWSPDIMVWNQDEDISNSLSKTHAIVEYTGKVFWSRPGHLIPSCAFEGLLEFPFDTLNCMMELGSWVYSGKYINVTTVNGGYTTGGSISEGEASTEFNLEGISVEEFLYGPVFQAAPEDHWPIVLYTLTFSRAWQPYVRGIILIQILLNIIVFMVFWLPPDQGERMGLAITAMLTTVAADIAIGEDLPMTNDTSWMERFDLVSLFFTFIPMIETAVVIYLHNNSSDNLFELTFFRDLTRKVKARKETKKEGSESVGQLEIQDPPFARSMRCIGIDDHANAKEVANNEYWRKISLYIDEISRIVFPLSYFIFLVTIMGPVYHQSDLFGQL